MQPVRTLTALFVDAGVVQTALSPELPLVEFDAVLIERVLVNLLETCRSPSTPEFTCLHPPPS